MKRRHKYCPKNLEICNHKMKKGGNINNQKRKEYIRNSNNITKHN